MFSTAVTFLCVMFSNLKNMQANPIVGRCGRTVKLSGQIKPTLIPYTGSSGSETSKLQWAPRGLACFGPTWVVLWISPLWGPPPNSLLGKRRAQKTQKQS